MMVAPGDFDGYIDEIRVTAGVALWTNTFTPPARRDTLSISDGMMYNGTCFDFDGTDDKVVTSDPVVIGTGDFTYTAWINRATVNGTDYICGNYGTGNYGVEFYGANNGGVRCYHRGNNVISATTLVADTWYHVAVTRSSGTGQIYINGAVDGASASIAGSIGAVLNFAIGNGPNYTSENFDGKIADVKVFDIALSAANLKELYDNSKVIIPSNVPQTNLKGWWTLAEGAGDMCYDGSGNGYDGTVSGEDGDEWITGQTGCPQLITGYNRPMKFDASNDYVQVASNGLTDFANQSFTISAWVNMPDVTPSGHDRIIFSYDYTAHSQPYYAIHLRVAATSGALEFYWNNGSVYQGITKSSPPLTDDTWHHIAGTFTSGSQKLYIDGVEVASGTNTTTISFYNQEVWIGRANLGGYWNGMINEVAYFKSALSASEIKALSTRGRLKELVVNGGFNADVSGWTINVGSSSSVTSVNGKAKMVDAASSGCRMDTPSGTPIALTSGKYYLAKVTLGGDRSNNGGTGSWFKWMIGSNYQGCQYHCPAYGTADNGGGEHSLVFKATGSSAYFGFTNGNDAGYVTVDDVSLVELGGPFDTSSQCLPPDAMAMGDDVAGQISAKSTNADESTYSYGGTTYKTWTYRSGGTFVVPRDIEVDVVVVGGGGGGGYNVGGGGGAGGLVSETLTAVQTADGGTSYSVVVGAGGLGRYASMSPPQCTSGGDSYITIDGATTAVGGGRGGGYITSWSDGPQSGGSGGGGRHSQGGAAGTAGQGNAGGSGTSSGGQYAGAGGGGAGAVGANAVFSSPNITAGDGGNGKNDFINSSAAETAALLAAALPTVGGGYLAGGGGGSRQGAGTTGAGGLGGGGKGSYYSTADGENGQVNTGGGGGGEMDGGSGVVIIRYAVPPVGGYWRNDGNSSWKDLSGNGNTGTVSGSPSTVLLKQGYTPSKSTNEGRDNQGFPLKYKDVGAIGFNGSDNEIVIGDTPDLTFGNGTTDSPFSIWSMDFTMEDAWINLQRCNNKTIQFYQMKYIKPLGLANGDS